MPKKQVYVREYKVKAHTRLIYTRTFQFICSYCHEEAERETYATTCPKYGNKCQGIATNCLRCQKTPLQTTKVHFPSDSTAPLTPQIGD